LKDEDYRVAIIFIFQNKHMQIDYSLIHGLYINILLIITL